MKKILLIITLAIAGIGFWGFSFTDWEGLFKQVKPSKQTSTNIQWFYIGWYFGFSVNLTDKSGRTKTRTGIQLWTGTGGVSGPFGRLFHGIDFTEEQRRIGGDPSMRIGSSGTDKIYAILVERNA